VDTAIAQVTVKKDGDSWAVDDYDLIPLPSVEHGQQE